MYAKTSFKNPPKLLAEDGLIWHCDRDAPEGHTRHATGLASGLEAPIGHFTPATLMTSWIEVTVLSSWRRGLAPGKPLQ